MNSGTLNTTETVLVPAIFADREHAEAAPAQPRLMRTHSVHGGHENRLCGAAGVA